MAKTQAQEAAVTAYATELLPAILGGEWKPAMRNCPGDLIRFRERRLCGLAPIDTHELFDHPLVFRRCGAKGPLTWQVGALLGRPYNAIDNDGNLTPQAAAGAQWLAE